MSEKAKILEVGPGINTATGGMASVILQIKSAPELSNSFKIDSYASYANGMSGFEKIKKEISNFLAFKKIANNYDLIHVHMTAKGSALRKTPYVLYAKRHGIPVIIHIHCCEYFTEQFDKQNGVYQKLVSKAIRSSDLVITLSNKTAEDIKNKFGISKCVCLPNGIDADKYMFSPKTNGLIFLGRLNEDKGLSILLRVMKQCMAEGVNEHLTVCGDTEGVEYQQIAEEMGLTNVAFTGWIDSDDIRKYLAENAVLLLPSAHEGAPIVILEAMASGCAVIATDVGAIPDMIPVEIISHKKDLCEKQLFERIKSLHNNPQRILREAENNREIVVNRYSQSALMSKLKDLYLDVLSNNAKRKI